MAEVDAQATPAALRARIRELEFALETLRTEQVLAEAGRCPDGLTWLLAAHGATEAAPLGDGGPPPPVAGLHSVVVPAYNAGRWLERCVRSVWNQEFPRERIELLVIDDGSRDDTVALAERLATQSPVSMHVLRHEGGRNRGVAATRALGCRRARGEFLALLDADDEFLPNRLAVADRQLAAHPEAVAVCALGRNVDEDGQPVRGRNGSFLAGDWRCLDTEFSPPFTFEQLWRATPVVNSALSLRSEAYARAGGYPAVMAHQSEDWLLVLKLSLLAPLPCAEDEVVLYRHHGAAYTVRYHKESLALGGRAELFFHLVWWMLGRRDLAERGAAFFRREYPGILAANARLFAVVREYVAQGGAAAPTPQDFEQFLARNQAELESLRRVVQAIHRETRLWRAEALALRARLSGETTQP